MDNYTIITIGLVVIAVVISIAAIIIVILANQPKASTGPNAGSVLPYFNAKDFGVAQQAVPKPTEMMFPSEAIGAGYNLGTGRFTAPKTGVYRFQCLFAYIGNGNGSTVAFNKNFPTTPVVLQSWIVPNPSTVNGNTLAYMYIATDARLQAGDVISVVMVGMDAYDYYVTQANGSFSGNFISG